MIQTIHAYTLQGNMERHAGLGRQTVERLDAKLVGGKVPDIQEGRPKNHELQNELHELTWP